MAPSANELKDQLYQKVRACLDVEFGHNIAVDLHSWLINYRADPSFLYQVWDLLAPSDPAPSDGHLLFGRPHQLTDEHTHLTFIVFADKLVVRFPSGDKDFPLPVARRAIQLATDALEDYLPLGSVVDLKKEHFSNILDTENIEVLRVVISQRLAAPPDALTYFSYGAAIYPIGVFEDNRFIYFSSPLIDSVVHRGFSDTTELAFIFALKDALIFTRGYQSFTFADDKAQTLAQQSVLDKDLHLKELPKDGRPL